MATESRGLTSNRTLKRSRSIHWAILHRLLPSLETSLSVQNLVEANVLVQEAIFVSSSGKSFSVMHVIDSLHHACLIHSNSSEEKSPSNRKLSTVKLVTEQQLLFTMIPMAASQEDST